MEITCFFIINLVLSLTKRNGNIVVIVWDTTNNVVLSLTKRNGNTSILTSYKRNIYRSQPN